MGLWLWAFLLLVLAVLFETDPTFGLRLILVGLAALGGWLIFRAWSRLRGDARQPVVSLDNAEPLVGQPIRLRYRPGTGGGDDLCGLTARLICRETSSHAPTRQRQGTSDSHDWVV